jgi:two-component system cell cycle response regulator
VLVVDDDGDIRQLVAEVLEAEGYRVLTADDGAAVPLARAERPDVLLLDVMMPGMDGPTISRLLRQDPTTAHIPIIAMTALSYRARQAVMLADVWLSKPFDLDALLQVVAQVLAPPA